MSSTPNLTEVLTRYAAGTTMQQLPADVVDQAKRVILDEMASAFLGAHRPAGQLARRYVEPVAGPEQAHLMGDPRRVAADQAALVNGTAGHADEIDGAHVVGGHPGATHVHAAVAAAQLYRTTGAELINAVVLGYDVGIRLIEACGGTFTLKERHHVHADFLHALGAAVSCGRLGGLTGAQLGHAMALASFQANGLCSLFGERRHLSKAFCNGQYAATGVRSAQMAAAGLEGSDDVLGAAHGALEAWGVDGAEALVTAELGRRHAIMGGNFKFLRAGYPIHAAVEAALATLTRHQIEREAVTAVEVGMPGHASRVVDDRAMHNICAQDMVAAAVLERRPPRLDTDPFPGILEDPRFAPMRARVSVHVDPDLEREDPSGRGAVVTVHTSGGRFLSRVDHPRGHSRRGGASWDELAIKWADALPGSDVARWVEAARGLEDLDDVSSLAGLFVTGAPVAAVG